MWMVLVPSTSVVPSFETFRVTLRWPLFTPESVVWDRTWLGSSLLLLDPPPHPAMAAGTGRAMTRTATRVRMRLKSGTSHSAWMLRGRPRSAQGSASPLTVPKLPRRSRIDRLLSAVRERAPDHPLYGQGRGREDECGRGHRPPLRGGRTADRDPVHGPGAQPVRFARRRAGAGAHRGRGAPVGTAGAGPARDGGKLGRGPALARRRAERSWRHGHRGRGAHRAPRHGRVVQPPADQAPPQLRGVRRDRGRLRAHGGDASPPVLSGDRQVVA